MKAGGHWRHSLALALINRLSSHKSVHLCVSLMLAIALLVPLLVAPPSPALFSVLQLSSSGPDEGRPDTWRAKSSSDAQVALGPILIGGLRGGCEVARQLGEEGAAGTMLA